jgi:hypothetical protein
MLEAAGIAVPPAPSAAPTFRIAPARRFHGIPRDRKRLRAWLGYTAKRRARNVLDPLVKKWRNRMR